MNLWQRVEFCSRLVAFLAQTQRKTIVKPWADKSYLRKVQQILFWNWIGLKNVFVKPRRPTSHIRHLILHGLLRIGWRRLCLLWLNEAGALLFTRVMARRFWEDRLDGTPRRLWAWMVFGRLASRWNERMCAKEETKRQPFGSHVWHRSCRPRMGCRSLAEHRILPMVDYGVTSIDTDINRYPSLSPS